MKDRRLSREVTAMLPWLAAALVWFGVIAPLRADRESRLLEQGRIRRQRVIVDRALRATETQRARVATTLGPACRASTDPAALRQRTVAVTSDLALSPFSLAVTGGASGGAVIDTEGSRAAVYALLERLGDPSRGGFLRTATIRLRESRWAASVTTGVFDSFPADFLRAPQDCPQASEAIASERGPEPKPKPGPTRTVIRKAPLTPPLAMPTLAPGAPQPTPLPFTLVAFLMSNGRSRVSVRIADQVRVISVGDRIAGFRCSSIDRDEGAVFTGPDGSRVVLKGGS